MELNFELAPRQGMTVAERKTELEHARFVAVRNLAYHIYKKPDGSPLMQYNETLDDRERVRAIIIQYEVTQGLVLSPDGAFQPMPAAPQNGVAMTTPQYPPAPQAPQVQPQPMAPPAAPAFPAPTVYAQPAATAPGYPQAPPQMAPPPQAPSNFQPPPQGVPPAATPAQAAAAPAAAGTGRRRRGAAAATPPPPPPTGVQGMAPPQGAPQGYTPPQAPQQFAPPPQAAPGPQPVQFAPPPQGAPSFAAPQAPQPQAPVAQPVPQSATVDLTPIIQRLDATYAALSAARQEIASAAALKADLDAVKNVATQALVCLHHLYLSNPATAQALQGVGPTLPEFTAWLQKFLPQPGTQPNPK